MPRTRNLEQSHQGSAREEKSIEAGSDCITSRATGSQYQLQNSFARRPPNKQSELLEAAQERISLGKYRRDLFDYSNPLTTLINEDGTLTSSQQKIESITISSMSFARQHPCQNSHSHWRNITTGSTC
ncbi:unnamed protein product [Strongylus vulgaris]|uniref:Uncharacterized protein n=1 Tax=Strongylus vulgaris TaxID=40348 RepID=A0A3P7J6I6_STRVU|nr:unnamed protein product [Strongylus vulgaris]